jgi:mannose-6-phosphate isomerase
MSIHQLAPLLVERLWGGHRLASLFASSTHAPIGEAWIASGHPSNPSTIRNGAYHGMTLRDL